MQPPLLSTAAHIPSDDREVDDAELWAIIDAAAANSHRTPLMLPSSSAAATVKRNPRHCPPQPSPDGEVVQQEERDQRWGYHHRPMKSPRIASPEPISGHNRRVMVVRHQSPASTYSIQEQGTIVGVNEVSPIVESPPPMPPVAVGQWRREEKGSVGPNLPATMPSPSVFKRYQNAAMEILEKNDYTMISGSPFIKKSGWRKIAFFFNISFEIKDKTIEFDENRNVQRAEFVVRAFMQGGRFSDGWGSCDRREKRFLKPNHDVPSTAETRAKNKACQDLLGIGEYRSVKSAMTNGYY